MGIAADGTFSYTFTSRPLGISLERVGDVGVKVSKVTAPREPIEKGDILLKLEGDDISKMTMGDIGKKLKAAELPFKIMFMRLSYHTEN